MTVTPDLIGLLVKERKKRLKDGMEWLLGECSKRGIGFEAFLLVEMVYCLSHLRSVASAGRKVEEKHRLLLKDKLKGLILEQVEKLKEEVEKL